MLSKLPPAVCLRGEGGGGATGLLRLPVEFPQVQTSKLLMSLLSMQVIAVHASILLCRQLKFHSLFSC